MTKMLLFLRRSFYGGERKNTFAVKNSIACEIDAGCPMADMITADALREAKKKYPGAVVVCYVNSSAEVKAESDICCTSSNAVEVVKSIPERTYCLSRQKFGQLCC